jgi:predicted MPP superfamily phosphohydrolase
MAIKSKISRRRFLVRSAAAAFSGLAIYGVVIEPRWISIERHELSIPGLPDSLDGTTAVQLSDLHVGSRVSDSYLLSQFKYVDSLKPEFVFFTGDYLDNGSKWHLEKGLRLLDHFPRGSIGNACVLGNHDFGNGGSELVEFRPNTDELIRQFGAAGLNLLRDETVDLGGLKIAGLRDYWFGGFNLSSSSSAIAELAGEPSIVLSHNPDTVDLPIWNGYDSTVLCGHTHGGQCRFPVIGAPICPVNNKRYVAGFYEIDAGHRLYINRGVGHTRRIRFMSRPEITVFTLKQA